MEKQWNTRSGHAVTRLIGGRCNVFLVEGGGVRLLVDTSVKRYRGKLDRRLTGHGIERLDYIVMTHTHFDHAGNLAYIYELYGGRVAVHVSEAAFLAEGAGVLPKGTNAFTSFMTEKVARNMPGSFRYVPCPAGMVIDGERTEIAEGIHTLHTPGHSAGSLCVVVDNEIAIAGDTIMGVRRNSVFPNFADDVSALQDSWEKLIATGCSVFLPSHGKEISRERLILEYEKMKTRSGRNK